MGVKIGVKAGVGNMGDEYCEEVSEGARGGDRKYPVSRLGAIRGHGERTNGEETPGESPACMPMETAVVTWPEVSPRMEDVSMTPQASSGSERNDAQASGRLGKKSS